MNGRPGPVGVILAGGASRRMGVDKAFVEIAGRPMVLRVADALSAGGCTTMFCQGGDSRRLAALGLDTHPDPRPHAGPVVAIKTALEAAGSSIVVVACDLADLTAAAVGAVLAAGSVEPPPAVAVAVAGGRAHLVSMWSADTLRPLNDLISDGVTAYRAALDRLGAVEVPVDVEAVRNVNRHEDLG